MKPTQLLTLAQWCALPAKQAANDHEDRVELAKEMTTKLARIGKTMKIIPILKSLGYKNVSAMDNEPEDLRKYIKLLRPLYLQHYPPAPVWNLDPTLGAQYEVASKKRFDV